MKIHQYFIFYKIDDCKIKPLHIMLPNMSTYVKSYECGETKWMNFLIKDDNLLKKI